MLFAGRSTLIFDPALSPPPGTHGFHAKACFLDVAPAFFSARPLGALLEGSVLHGPTLPDDRDFPSLVAQATTPPPHASGSSGGVPLKVTGLCCPPAVYVGLSPSNTTREHSSLPDVPEGQTGRVPLSHNHNTHPGLPTL